MARMMIASISPASWPSSFSGATPRALARSAIDAWPSTGCECRAACTAALGRNGSVTQIERSSSSWLADEEDSVYGRKPVSS